MPGSRASDDSSLFAGVDLAGCEAIVLCDLERAANLRGRGYDRPPRGRVEDDDDRRDSAVHDAKVLSTALDLGRQRCV